MRNVEQEVLRDLLVVDVRLDPVILQQLLGRLSRLGITYEHFLEEVFGVLRARLPNVALITYVFGRYLHEDLVLAATLEWRLARQHDVAEDAEGPHVHRAVVRYLLYDFWCHVERRA